MCIPEARENGEARHFALSRILCEEITGMSRSEN